MMTEADFFQGVPAPRPVGDSKDVCTGLEGDKVSQNARVNYGR